MDGFSCRNIFFHSLGWQIAVCYITLKKSGSYLPIFCPLHKRVSVSIKSISSLIIALLQSQVGGLGRQYFIERQLIGSVSETQVKRCYRQVKFISLQLTVFPFPLIEDTRQNLDLDLPLDHRQGIAGNKSVNHAPPSKGGQLKIQLLFQVEIFQFLLYFATLYLCQMLAKHVKLSTTRVPTFSD